MKDETRGAREFIAAALADGVQRSITDAELTSPEREMVAWANAQVCSSTRCPSCGAGGRTDSSDISSTAPSSPAAVGCGPEDNSQSHSEDEPSGEGVALVDGVTAHVENGWATLFRSAADQPYRPASKAWLARRVEKIAELTRRDPIWRDGYDEATD